MTASEALREILQPVLKDWRFQFGRWIDGGKAVRYAVLRPMGGPMAGLVRQPAFSLVLIGAAADPLSAAERKAEDVIQKLFAESGSLVFAQTGEPIYWATGDGRPVAEIAIHTIINR
ncbi:hypothetical protein DJFAAGMI_01273 [Comamonas sp. PE63]|uniref:Uncharacterized protein n=1 Tax=Comamonas brasiliensis TaxID=1812482 RepID=A0ABS5LPV7_9BURK|nr:hypothetical protein [Comamonas sp. PE63]MBS3018541.1 hypothetical protein [Comamonas sp. PE63]